MNEIEFNGKRKLWGKLWNPPSSSIRIPVASVWPEPPTFQEQQRYTYGEWLASGKEAGMMSAIYSDHPDHEHQHLIHVWGEPAFYDPDDPREPWTSDMPRD